MDQEMQKTFKPAFLSPNGQQEVIFFAYKKKTDCEKASKYIRIKCNHLQR